MSDTARIAGTIVAISDPAPARWQVRIGNRRWQRSEGGWFEVDTGTERVWVEVSSLVEIFGDADEEDGLLEDLAPRAGMIGELGPPGTPATLARIALSVGLPVAVAGDSVGPGVVRGLLVETGPDAAQRLTDTLQRRAATPLRRAKRSSRSPRR
jgi:hypothetical protein